MTIYSSTTLAELLDELDMRAPDLAAPIRERVEELEEDLADARERGDDLADVCADQEVRIEALGFRIEELEGES